MNETETIASTIADFAARAYAKHGQGKLRVEFVVANRLPSGQMHDVIAEANTDPERLSQFAREAVVGLLGKGGTGHVQAWFWPFVGEASETSPKLMVERPDALQAKARELAKRLARQG